jgi:hypothetical protein
LEWTPDPVAAQQVWKSKMHETVRTAWKVSAWFFLAVGVGAGVVCYRIPWAPRFDFDILGVAWLFLNFGKLGAFALMVLCFLFSAYLWIRLRLGG